MAPSSNLNKSETDFNAEARESGYIDIGSIQTFPISQLVEYTSTGEGLDSLARVTEDGRIVISLDAKKALPHIPKSHRVKPVEEFAVDKNSSKAPKMNIVIMIVGSRGDVQPYVALGKRLMQDGHRIRLATHETFREFVTSHGLEFYSIGGDPMQLMAYMVKNPGLLPGRESLMNGDIGKKRIMITEMLNGCWLSCYMPCPRTGKSFIADAIIANPPSFAHIHCAEALGIPLHMSFTMPWTSTEEFTHPLVNIASSNARNGMTNILSFALAEILTWQGTGDLINDLREKSLGLQSLSLQTGPGILDRLYIPWSYCMSPSLVPKPSDWKDNVDIVGFYFLPAAPDFQPPDDLMQFLGAKDSPVVYIGFGSVVVEDPGKMTKTIFEATQRAGVRALVSAGWGGLGGVTIPSHIFILGNIPHDWLFDMSRVQAVIHHGGAGTTAIGLAKGQPTCVIPFFGDQEFWGSMIHQAGAGPKPIPQKELCADNLSEALGILLSEPAKASARRIADQISNEGGISHGVESFYRHLPLLNMRCDLDPSRVAVWFSVEHCLKLSTFATQVLIDAHLLEAQILDLHRPKEYDVKPIAKDPLFGGAVAIFWMVTHHYAELVRMVKTPVRGLIKTTAAIPKGVLDILSTVSEGMSNTPRLYGSTVRQSGKRSDWQSGFKEAGKSVFYGYYDGITGLYKTPIAGAKKEGIIGAIKGAAKSWIDVTVKPAGGIINAIVFPLEGTWNSGQSKFRRRQDSQQRQTRIAQGLDDVRASTAQERDSIIRAFKSACQNTPERQKKYAEAAKEALIQSQEQEQEQVKKDLEVPRTSSSSSQAEIDSEAVTFLRDIERAKEASLREM